MSQRIKKDFECVNKLQRRLSLTHSEIQNFEPVVVTYRRYGRNIWACELNSSNPKHTIQTYTGEYEIIKKSYGMIISAAVEKVNWTFLFFPHFVYLFGTQQLNIEVFLLFEVQLVYLTGSELCGLLFEPDIIIWFCWFFPHFFTDPAGPVPHRGRE